MQQIKFQKFLRQLWVEITRCFVLIWNDKLTLASLVLQAPVMVVVFKLVGDPSCFTSNLINIGSRTILFILCAVSAFMGILNAYREICKERDIIFREASVGVSLVATVLSKMVVLFVIELVQAAILTVGFCAVIVVPQNNLLFSTNVEIYITVLLMLFASSAMGMLVSASLKSSESAILFVLVLIIGQVVFSGCMFSLKGAQTIISYIIICRWGMGALGASTDLNSRLAWLKAGLDDSMYDATIPNLLHSWQMLGLIALVCIIAACLVLQTSFNRRKT
ncbi:MAG: ABC transporter permease [Gemmiger sp.]|nr:ABC transporter permease [Gemmiger sp.]